jgi:AcrR family transcriptional regulator
MIREKSAPTSAIPPKQARSQARLERILDSAERVFAQHGFESACIAQIMAEAGSSVGLFYQRFRSKEDVFEAVVHRFTQKAKATVDQLLTVRPIDSLPPSTPLTYSQGHPLQPSDGGSRNDLNTRSGEQAGGEFENQRALRVLLDQVMPVLVDVYRSKRGLLRAILLRASTERTIHTLAHQAEQHIEQALERVLFDSAPTSPDRIRLFRLGYQMLRSTLNTMTLFNVPERAGLNLDDEDLSAQLTEAFWRIVAPGFTKQTHRNETSTGGVRRKLQSKRRRS